MKGNALLATALVAGTASAGVHKMKYDWPAMRQ
jgi:hypothetical protein